MPVTRIKQGLDLPLSGGLTTTDIGTGPPASEVALLPRDAVGIKPRLLVREGDAVERGTGVYVDRRQEEVLFTSPIAGTVKAVHRGDRRRLLSVVIEAGKSDQALQFGSLDPAGATSEQVRDLLCRSGLWTLLRQRPFDKIAIPSQPPRSLFITAMETAPLAPPPEAILSGQEDSFRTGVAALRKLVKCPIYLCTAAGATSGAYQNLSQVEHREFSGPHPAGNVGVHINALDPVGAGRHVWHIGYQGVCALGKLCQTGQRPNDLVVAVVGPGVKRPQFIQTTMGIAMSELLADNVASQPARIISGSVLSGQSAPAQTTTGYLGAFDNLVTVLADTAPRRFLGWMMPGFDRYSITNTYVGKFLRSRFDFDTDTNGSKRAIVPIGSYEKVMPMDIQATFLIKALASDDIESAEKLGALELAEEDVALCEYVCPSKIDVTGLLRKMLTRIEKEG